MHRIIPLALSLAWLAFGSAQAMASLYIEVPDAGDQFDPQPVSPPGEHFTGIGGDIGGPDTYDAFLFYFAGGEFSGVSSYGSDLLLELFSSSDPGAAIASGTNGIDTIASIAAGNYILGFATSAALDPPFTFTLAGPTAENPNIPQITIQAPAGVPEPASLATVGLGLAGMAFHKRRRANS